MKGVKWAAKKLILSGGVGDFWANEKRETERVGERAWFSSPSTSLLVDLSSKGLWISKYSPHIHTYYYMLSQGTPPASTHTHTPV